jgi:hypothetical protein
MAVIHPIKGFAPDAPPDTPGIITDCTNVIPTLKGIKAQGSPLDGGLPALASQARSLVVTKNLSNTKRVLASTQTNIYESDGSTWINRSKSAGAYDLGTEPSGRVRFAQFGNVTIAAVGHTDPLQYSTSGAFADITGAPSGKIVETVNNFVFAFNFSGEEDGWQCSALGDETDWVPSISTQSVSGRLIESPGPIVGARKLGANIVAYKETSAFIAQYVGSPSIWTWQKLPGDVGAVCHEAIVTVGTAHYFIGLEDIYMFDGSRSVSIGTPLREWFFNELDPRYRDRIYGSYDRLNGLVYWWFPSKSGNGTIDACIVYNIKADSWGKSVITVDCVAEYIDPGVTYDGLGAEYTTWDDLPTDISFDSSFWTAESPVLAFVLSSDKKVYTFGAVPGNTTFTTGIYGDLIQFSTVNRVTPRFLTIPTSGQLLYSYSDDSANFTQNITSSMTSNRFDLIWSSRWHKFQFSLNGNYELTGINIDAKADGTE